MTISRKPKKNSDPSFQHSVLEEKEIANLINKGGSIATQEIKPDNGETPQKNVQLRLLISWLNRIDNVRKQQPVKTPRHTWFLEAISEKLERDEANISS